MEAARARLIGLFGFPVGNRLLGVHAEAHLFVDGVDPGERDVMIARRQPPDPTWSA